MVYGLSFLNSPFEEGQGDVNENVSRLWFMVYGLSFLNSTFEEGQGDVKTKAAGFRFQAKEEV
jgi:hypothetical protein